MAVDPASLKLYTNLGLLALQLVRDQLELVNGPELTQEEVDAITTKQNQVDAAWKALDPAKFKPSNA